MLPPTSAAAQTSTPAEDGVFDRTHLAQYTLGEPAFERELLSLFVDQFEALLARLRAAQSASDWRLATHTLKGSAAAVGATEINRLALVLEERGFAGTPAATDADIAALEGAGQRFAAAVATLIA